MLVFFSSGLVMLCIVPLIPMEGFAIGIVECSNVMIVVLMFLIVLKTTVQTGIF